MSIPLAPAIIWYVFGMINSWSRLPIFGAPNFEDPQDPPKAIAISFSRQVLSSNIPEFANTLDEFKKRYGLCQFSVCHHLSKSNESKFTGFVYEWKMTLLETREEEIVKSENCSLVWQAKAQGSYDVRVLIKKQDDDQKIMFTGQHEFKVLDYWIAAIGDSFSSGEGNPDKPVDPLLKTPAVWLSKACHRSRRSWAYKTYKKLEILARTSALHFTFIPCSGASSNDGILTSSSNESQIDVLGKISNLRGRGPDLLMMSVGGNDVGYGEILNSLINRVSQSMFNSIEMRLFYVAHQLERIGQKLNARIKPTQVVVPHYFDLIRNEYGQIDSNCPDLKNIPTESLRLAEKNILRRVNRLISDKGRKFGWTVVEEVPKLFRTGGICSRSSLIRNTKDSLRIQGDTLGAFHPVEEAHRSIADLIWRKLNFKQLMLI